MGNPVVFISYSHDNENHKMWVLKLATDLRSHGVEVIFDQWDLRIGSDLRLFMEKGLSESELVICICSDDYVQKVDSGSGGSGYEGMIMTQALLQDAKSEYIISIVRNNQSSRKVPLAFGSKLYIDFSDDDQYDSKYNELLERIYNEDIKRKPPLGNNPFSIELSERIEIKKRIEDVKYHSPAMEGNVVFRFDNNNGVFTIGNGEYAFNTRWNRSGNNSIYASGSIGYSVGATEFPAVAEIASFDFSSNCRTIRTGQIVIFENESKHFAAIKLGSVKSSSHGNPYDEMTFDYHIYNGI